MDRARVEDLLARAVSEQVQSLRDWRDTLASLVTRIGVLEDSIAQLRSGPTAAPAGTDLREVVSGELATVALILRREIDDLGRRLHEEIARIAVLVDDAMGRDDERRVIDLNAGR